MIADMQKGWLQAALGLAEKERPFPWQTRLLERFVREATIPRALDIPTGLGKTSVMAIWLIARASGARLPRRLVYVVDRRAVVDQATTEAERLRAWVDDSPGVKEVLGLKGSLPISTLRGQHVDNRQWLEDPASTAIIVGTVDMVGSRLLFDGYGVSRKMRSYHAGLLGADTLAVLDEAHLVPPFEKLLKQIDQSDTLKPRDMVSRDLVPRFRLMSLSATGRSIDGDVLDLSEEDLAHEVLQKRLYAKKRLRIQPLDAEAPVLIDTISEKRPTSLATQLAQEAWTLTENGRRPARVLIFSDKQKDAQKAKSEIERLAKVDKKAGEDTIDTDLFVGGRRVFEREQAKERLVHLGFLASGSTQRTKSAFLFATSAAEVGVDLDADYMVSDLVAWERMVQRLGRVNRRGHGAARVIVLVGIEPKPKKNERAALTKKQAGEVLEEKEQRALDTFEARLREWKAHQAPFAHLPRDNDSYVDASPSALRKLKQNATRDPELQKVLVAATTPEPLRPALTRALVDAWSLTSLEVHTGRPAIDPWLRGWIEDDPPHTAVAWRTKLPVRSGLQPSKRDIEAFFESLPPHTSELLETETFRVMSWLSERAKRLRKRSARDVPEEAEAWIPAEGEVVAFALTRDGEVRRALKLDDFCIDRNDKERKEELQHSLEGSTLVVDARLAGLKDGLLDSEENRTPRCADDGQSWLGDGVIRFRVRSTDTDDAQAFDNDWRERFRFAIEVSEEGEPHRWLIVEKWRHDATTEEDRSAARPQLLDEHQSWAEQRSRALAKRLGLDATYEDLLAIAARLHDEGKRAMRWQKAFNAPGGGPYAKTKGPINYALLDGYRHEFGSLPYAEMDEQLKKLPHELRDLALHLIAAHHGFARPVIGINGCADAPPSTVQARAREVALRFARLQKYWGPWGLAWWETLLRAADQQASRDNDEAEARAAREVE